MKIPFLFEGPTFLFTFGVSPGSFMPRLPSHLINLLIVASLPRGPYVLDLIILSISTIR